VHEKGSTASVSTTSATHSTPNTDLQREKEEGACLGWFRRRELIEERRRGQKQHALTKDLISHRDERSIVGNWEGEIVKNLEFFREAIDKRKGRRVQD